MWHSVVPARDAIVPPVRRKVLVQLYPGRRMDKRLVKNAVKNAEQVVEAEERKVHNTENISKKRQLFVSSIRRLQRII